MQQLSQSLAENLSALDARFGQSADYYAKKIVLYGCPGCIVMFDGMASLDSLWELLLDAAGRQSASVRLTGTQAYAHILHGSAFPAESTPVQDMSQLVARLTAGMAVLLLEGCSSGIVFSVQGLKFRSVEEPSAEGNLRGSREGFTDLLRVNLSLLRRLVRTDTLMQEAAQAHTCCNTEYALCYCKDRADPAMVQRVRAILQSARPELLLDSSYFVPWLLPGKARLFTPVSYTERPAVAAAKICEGKIVVLASGRPTYGVMPLAEELHLEDYGGYILSFLVAWALAQLSSVPRTVLTVIFYSPSMTGATSMTVLWKIIFSGDQMGYLNSWLMKLGVIDAPIIWLLDSRYLLPIIIIVALWSSMGVGFLAMLAGILNADEELYEAAAIDGVKNRFQEMIYITIPTMKPQMLFGAVMAIVGAFQNGAIGVQLSGTNPTPNYAGQLIVNHIEDYGFLRYEMGYAAAVSVVLLLMVYAFSKFFGKMFRED